MNVEKLKAVLSSLISEDDPHKVPKRLDLKNWCNAFSVLFAKNGAEHIPFFLEILSEEECWENTNTIHRVRLNRRAVARKIVKANNSRGRINPLNFLERYLVACWCCLEKDILDLFLEFKEDKSTDNRTALKMLRDEIGPSEQLATYWTYIVSGYDLKMKVKGNLYEHGLNLVFVTFKPFVEAVDFFWIKIKSLPEYEYNSQQKSEIILNTTIRAAASVRFRNYPEIFEFCITQINPDVYPELLQRNVAENHSILLILLDVLRLDLIRNLFDSCKPDALSGEMYHTWLKYLAEIDDYSDYNATAAVNLFMYIWMKEGFDRHRAFVLEKEMSIFCTNGIFLSFAKRNYLEPVWAVLDKASPDQLKVFMRTGPANYIFCILEKRGNLNSLKKFNSYKLQ